MDDRNIPLFLSNYQRYPQVEKVWGREYWLENNESYCAKLLYIRAGYQCSLHYHKIKDETFLVLDGTISLETTSARRLQPDILHPGQKTRIHPYVAHRFTGITNAIILEVSTYHDDLDVVRLEESKKCLPDSTND
jgi:mannose-6-phosphate isomerase-like protein (cupin superfamily)